MSERRPTPRECLDIAARYKRGQSGLKIANFLRLPYVDVDQVLVGFGLITPQQAVPRNDDADETPYQGDEP